MRFKDLKKMDGFVLEDISNFMWIRYFRAESLEQVGFDYRVDDPIGCYYEDTPFEHALDFCWNDYIVDSSGMMHIIPYIWDETVITWQAIDGKNLFFTKKV